MSYAKTCRICRVEKAESAFYAGHARCKECYCAVRAGQHHVAAIARNAARPPKPVVFEKKCRECLTVKPVSAFYRDRGKSIARCRDCVCDGHKAKRRENPSFGWYFKRPSMPPAEQTARNRAACRKAIAKVRKAVVAGYGGACVCCGETRENFLALDHKNGGGSKERRELKMGNLAKNREVVKAGFPAEYQLLCHSCNLAKGFYGVCPHISGASLLSESIEPFDSSGKTRVVHNSQNPMPKVESQARDRARVRVAALDAYGSACACCGEHRHAFLGIDHVNNDGAEHRREIGRTSLYRWLRQNGYPEGFQVLCHNCNLAKGFYGHCPHQQERALLAEAATFGAAAEEMVI